jgi:HlyD family secretion protein
MTAVATIVATERKDVLLVPNTALRFVPGGDAGTKGAGAQSGGILSKMMPRPPRSGAKTARTDKTLPSTRQIWLLKDGQPQAAQVTTGISDGRMTEVSGEGLAPGLPVITDQRSSGAGA